MRLPVTILLTLLLTYTDLQAQVCTVLGQNPSTAFPVCGITSFEQQSVPLCGNKIIPGCDGVTDTNPFWYRFTCYQSGTLGFLIIPKTLEEDYDWELFDITGHNPDEVYTNASLIVTANWAGTYGTTGASSSGVNYVQCGSDPADHKPTFAQMPNITEGHTYLLLISHYTNTQSGYNLSFGGGSASITDPMKPDILSAKANCEGKQISIKLNKKMKCSSLAHNGSDFIINAAGISIIDAEAASCSSGFDMDSVIITLSKALSPGDYIINIKTGSDDNTLLDNCDNALAAGSSINITVLPKQPTPLDSIAIVSCAPQTLRLVFRNPIRCSSIEPSGSDFLIAGPYPVSIQSAEGICNNGLTDVIMLQLNSPVVHEGTYSIVLQQGTDGNTITDECAQVIPAGSSINFFVKDTVSANFTATLLYGCKSDSVYVSHDGRNGITNWNWMFDSSFTRTTQNATVVYTTYGQKNISLAVTNGFCSDTASTVVNLDNELKAKFTAPKEACPGDIVSFTDTSIGTIVSYNWNLGLGEIYTQKTPPPQVYPQASTEKIYTARLIIENNLHCFDTVYQQVKVFYSCYIAVPTAFTPNGDGVNDYLYPLNAFKADNLIFNVYNRYGQVVYHTNDWTKKWDGTINGKAEGNGTYVWTLSYTNRDTKQVYVLKGTSVLIK